MAIVQALTGFDHYGSHKRGELFPVSDQHARKLRQAGLVVIVGEGDNPRPKKASGSQSSASPAAQVLPQMTVKSSGDGETRKRKRRNCKNVERS